MGMERLFRVLRTVACSGFLLAFATVAQAHPIGELGGVVRDNTGGALPGVSLTLSGALITPRTVVTDEHGNYEIERLPAGRYSLTAFLRGLNHGGWISMLTPVRRGGM